MYKPKHKKSRFGFLGNAFMGIAAVVGFGFANTPSNFIPETKSNTTVSTKTGKENKEQVSQQSVVEKESKRNIEPGERNIRKHYRTPKKNQRQYRKLWRQNPHLRNKK